MSSCPSNSAMELPFDVIVLDDEKALGARRGKVLDAVEGRDKSFGGWFFDEVGKGAVRQAMLALFFERDDLHRNMARCWIELELVEHRPSQHVGQENIQRDG